MARCLVGCGSNLGPKRDLLDRAIELLRFMPGVTVLETSRFRESRAIGGPADQPAFLNGACLVETDLSPHDLLDALQAVENTLERQRDVRWGPRTIDLDLLIYGTLEIDHEHLTLPHPRMTTRRFVLEPCAEIAPDFLHPSTGCSVRDLLANINLSCPRIAVCGIPGSGAAEVAATLADATMGHAMHGCMSFATAIAPKPAHRRLKSSLATAEHWSAQLAVDDGVSECRTSVADFWIGSLAAANAELIDDGTNHLSRGLREFTTSAPLPHVLILLQLSRESLGEKIRFCRGPFAAGSGIFADLETCLNTACGEDDGSAPCTDEEWTDRLLAMQTQLQSMLCGPRSRQPWLPVPKGIVRIDADDLAAAADEALAAVEAMA